MKIFFSAGEPSGDQHASHLIQELRVRRPKFVAEGFGGPHMQVAGCHLYFELTELAVMGFLRVIPMLAKFWRLVQQAEAHFTTNPPDAVVLVDSGLLLFASTTLGLGTVADQTRSQMGGSCHLRVAV